MHYHAWCFMPTALSAFAIFTLIYINNGWAITYIERCTLIEFPHTEDDIAGYLARVLRAELRVENGSYFFKIRGIAQDREFSLNQVNIQAITASIRSKYLNDETALFSDTSFEIIVREENPFPARRIRDDVINVSDNESGITYEVSPASDEYLIWMIATASIKGTLRDLGFGMFPPRMRIERLLAEEGDEPLDALDLLRAVSIRLITLKVISTSKQSLRRFLSATYSFLFHLAYNIDIALVPQRFFDEFSRRGRISRIRRSTTDELDPPRRTYNEDLVNHYVLAISTDSPTVQFLSHYHVLEHFFESVFNDDLIEQIKTSITQPGFSYKRKKDIGQLISTIKKSLQIRSETITFSEPEALRLSLTKFLDISQLVARLEEYEPTLIDYYANTEVPFSKGATVALRSGESESIIRNLTRRIYATRNSLVHSKDGDKAQYTPFKDERALLMEVPLMRFVSEMVILAVSEVV
jgi:hypothetical protein